MRSRMALAVTVLGLMLLMGSTTAQAGTGSITLKFHLPFNGTVNTPKTGFKITNAGSGNGLEGDSTGGTGNGVYGSTNSGNAGVWGTNTGSGMGVYGGAGSGGLAGVYGIATGSVTGVWGTSANGVGVAGSSNGGVAVSGHSGGDYGVSGVSDSGYAGVFGSGPHNGLYGDVNNSGDSGVYGHNFGTGNGIAGISANGAGAFIQGKTTGAYVAATGGGASPALKIGSGGVQVFGAGTDTSTPVFRHQVTNSNTCNTGEDTILDNPYLNGNPSAFVFLQDTYSGAILMPTYNGGAGCPSGRWTVRELVGNTFYPWIVGATFNVLVVDP